MESDANNIFSIQSLISWGADHGIKILLILLAAYIVRKFSHVIITRAVRRAIPSSAFLTKEAEIKREDTLIQIFSGTVNVVVIIITLMMIVSEFGVDIGPIMAGAGILGVALGFGAQYLVRDVISGLFIILENQYRVGDWACLDDTCGTVEHISLRTTLLRDVDGSLHFVPNGGIARSTNHSKDFSRVILNIGVAYDSDIDKVAKTINEVGKKLAEHEDWKDKILEPPTFLRVQDFGASEVLVRVTAKTKPLAQWEVGGELRRRIKEAFDKEGIEIPFPQRVIHNVK